MIAHRTIAAVILALAFALPAAAAEPTPAPSPSPAPSASPTPAGNDYFLPRPARPDAPPPVAPSGGHDRAGYAYSYATYDSRYDDAITSLDLYKPLGSMHARVRPFVSLGITRDSRTHSQSNAQGAEIPLVYSDNYGVAGAGLQYTTPHGLRLYVQGGVSQTIGPVAAMPSGSDARGGLQYYHDFGPAGRAHASYGSLYVGATYYSRYSDAILYAQAERVANLGPARRPMEAFVRSVLTLDTHGFYYSNLAEATVGLRWHPFGPQGPAVSLEQTAGRYVRGVARPAGIGAAYADFRPTVSLGFSL